MIDHCSGRVISSPLARPRKDLYEQYRRAEEHWPEGNASAPEDSADFPGGQAAPHDSRRCVSRAAGGALRCRSGNGIPGVDAIRAGRAAQPQQFSSRARRCTRSTKASITTIWCAWTAAGSKSFTTPKSRNASMLWRLAKGLPSPTIRCRFMPIAASPTARTGWQRQCVITITHLKSPISPRSLN